MTLRRHRGAALSTGKGIADGLGSGGGRRGPGRRRARDGGCPPLSGTAMGGPRPRAGRRSPADGHTTDRVTRERREEPCAEGEHGEGRTLVRVQRARRGGGRAGRGRMAGRRCQPKVGYFRRLGEESAPQKPWPRSPGAARTRRSASTSPVRRLEARGAPAPAVLREAARSRVAAAVRGAAAAAALGAVFAAADAAWGQDGGPNHSSHAAVFFEELLGGRVWVLERPNAGLAADRNSVWAHYHAPDGTLLACAHLGGGYAGAEARWRVVTSLVRRRARRECVESRRAGRGR